MESNIQDRTTASPARDPQFALDGGTFQKSPPMNLTAGPMQETMQLTSNNKGVDNPADVILVSYTGGIGGNATGSPPVDGGNTTQQIAFNVLAEAQAAGLRTFSTVISAGREAAPAVTEGYNYIKARYGQGTRILIYGYSRGGDCAAELAHRLNGDDIPVHMLITVDGALGPFSATHVEREIPPNVVHNMNQYQTHESSIGSRGDANYATDEDRTRITNVDVGDHSNNISHGNIDEAAAVVNSNLLMNAAGLEVDWSTHNYEADADNPQGWFKRRAASSSDSSSDSTSSGSTSSGDGSFRDRDSSSSESSSSESSSSESTSW